jgi:hypothetical protein
LNQTFLTTVYSSTDMYCYCHVFMVMTNNNGFLIGFINTLFYSPSSSQSIAITHTKWLPRTRFILVWTTTDLNYGRLPSDLNGLLYSISISKEMFVDHLYPRKCVGFQESISVETCFIFLSQEMCSITNWFPRIHLYRNVFVTSSLAMGLHIILSLK